MATTTQEMKALAAETTVWYKDSGRRKLYFLVFVAILSSATNGYDGSLMNGLQALPYYKDFFHHPAGATQGLLNAIQSVGGIASLIIGPYMVDYLGRKWTIQVGCVVVVLAGIIQCASVNIHMFTAARFLIGLGSGFSGLASPILITELAHPVERAKVTTLYNTMYYFGAFLGGWITYATLRIPSNWAWRLPSLLQAAPSAVQVCLVFLLPESPRWLISKGRDEQAFKVLVKYHADGNEQDEHVRLEFNEIKLSIQNGVKGRWSELFSTAGARRAVFISFVCGVFSQWSGTSLTGYYLNNILTNIGITDPWYSNRLNGFILMVNMFEAWFWAFMVDRVGRRPLFLISAGGMICTFSIWTALTARQLETGSVALGKGIIAMIFFHNFFYNFAWIGLNIAYPLELLPFNIRANGLLMQNIATYICLFLNQYLIPIGIDHASWKFYFLFLGMIVLQFFTIFFFFPETRGATLEEINRTTGGAEAVDNFKAKALELDNMPSSSIMRTSMDKHDRKEADFGVTHLDSYEEKSNDQVRRRQPSVDNRDEL